MADNTMIAAQSGGDVIATDDVGGVKFQRVKVTYGADGAAADVAAANPLPVTTSPANTELTGSVTSATTLIASTDVRGYSRFSLQLSGPFSATAQVQGSNDNTTWTPYATYTLGATGSPNSASLTGVGIYHAVIVSRYLRVQVTAYTSGTVVGTLELTSTPGVPNVAAYVGNAISTSLPTAAAVTDTYAMPSTPTLGAGNLLYNGVNWDRIRAATAADAGTGTGVLAAGALGWDSGSSLYRRMKVGASGDQAVSITSPALGGATFAAVSPMGSLQVTMDSTLMMGDTFDTGAIDTNKWATYGTVAPSASTGNIAVNPGATASATSVMQSVPSFVSTTAITFGSQMSIEATTIATGNHRFWGLGQTTAQPGTSAAPLTNAIGFEITTGGQLRAVVYNAGAVAWSQNLTTPTDGFPHRYAVLTRADVSWFFLDNFDVPAAFTYIGAGTQTLPMRVHSLNSGAVTGTPTLNGTGLVVYDEARQNQTISDPTYPFRRATVTAAGALQVIQAQSATSSLTSVASSATSVQLLAANVLRKDAIIVNDSTAVLYVALAATASTTAYTWQLPPGGSLDMPVEWTGAVSGIWSAANGNARITELT